MQAVLVERFGPVESQRLAEVAVPEPGTGEVRIRVAAAAIGFVDGLKIQGLYQTRDPLPFIPGMEFAGVVDAVGAGVARLAPGQRVLGLGLRGAGLPCRRIPGRPGKAARGVRQRAPRVA